MNLFVVAHMASPDPYRHIYEQYAEEASFLWHLRSIVVDQPHYTAQDLSMLDRRIDAQLDGLMASPEESWSICESTLERQEAGAYFAASVLAFRSLDVGKIQKVVETATETPDGRRGIASALGWLPGRLCHSWIKKFITSKDFEHKYLAIAAFSLRRENPGEYLTGIFKRPDCLAHSRLYARALRLVGELKRHDLMPAVRIGMRADDPAIVFWANWSAVLLGDKSAAIQLRPYVMEVGPLQSKAIDLAFRSLPLPEARAWITDLTTTPDNLRQVIKASAVLGDPHAISWLIGQMQNPALSRIAGEAFTAITGIDLEQQGLDLKNLPNLDQYLPNDDPADGNVDLDEDENLPFPDVAKVAAVWQTYQQRFAGGQRYFLGRKPSVDSLQQVLLNRGQRLRHAAAMELALIDSGQMLINTRARIGN